MSISDKTNYRNMLRSSTSVYNCILRIKSGLDSENYQNLNKANKGTVDLINEAIIDVEAILKANNTRHLRIRSEKSPENIEKLWDYLDRTYSGQVTEDFKNMYEKILEITKDFLISLINMLPLDNNQTVPFRVKSTEDEQERLESISKRRLEVKKLYEKALKNEPRDEEMINKLKNQLDALGETYIETKMNLDGIKTDSAEEERMRNRIDDAFNFLSNDNHLDKELTKLQWEFYCMLVLIAITVVVFFVFYGTFLYNLNTLKLTGWYEYLPYTMSVPITIGLLWLFVYLKNRANKISIEISSRLYDIRYMEGLMKMTNTMSRTSDEASKKIEELIRSMVDSFLNKMSDRTFKEKDMSIIEKQEIENSPYWKFLSELKDLINLIKK